MNTEPTPNILNALTQEQLNHLTHSLGVQIGSHFPPTILRNYSLYYDKNADCEHLVSIGLMTNREQLGSQVYQVTEMGIEAVKTLFE